MGNRKFYTKEDDDDDKTSEYQEIFVNNLLRRLTRLYEYTFISW